LFNNNNDNNNTFSMWEIMFTLLGHSWLFPQHTTFLQQLRWGTSHLIATEGLTEQSVCNAEGLSCSSADGIDWSSAGPLLRLVTNPWTFQQMTFMWR
jgi:hypothetical protein